MEAGIPVQGHIGLIPQTASLPGGFKVQGKSLESAKKLIDEAKYLEEAGAFSIVLECVPEELGRAVSEAVSMPVIGIGACRYCDGQVLVFHDMLGLFDKFVPRFVKQYKQIGEEIIRALQIFNEEVKQEQCPSEEHVFSGISREDIEEISKLD